jgi:histidinol-phosphatase (PHP family)
MGLVDFHIHTVLSCDGHCTIDEVCRRAIEISLDSICFTEHLDLDPNDPGYGFLDCEEYSRQVEEARKRYGTQISILKGIEADYQSRFENQLRDWLCDKKFDLVLGSVHYVDGVTLSEELVRTRSLDELYGVYIEEVRLSAESGLFDVIGHLDYVKKYTGNASYLESSDRLRPALEETLRSIIISGTALEVSTKGLVAKSRDYRPSLGIVRLYRDLGGRKISIGSDAHDTGVLGTGVAALSQLTRKMGLEITAGSKSA